MQNANPYLLGRRTAIRRQEVSRRLMREKAANDAFQERFRKEIQDYVPEPPCPTCGDNFAWCDCGLPEDFILPINGTPKGRP